MGEYLVALDQGTSSSRALLFDRQARLLGSHSIGFALHYPQPGWVEVDPMTLWATQLECLRVVLDRAGVAPDQIHALGISNQRETVVAWDRRSGQPLGPAIVWQCRRSADACANWREQGLEPAIRARTGLLLDAYFSATKMRWMLEHWPAARALAARGELCLGTVDSWLIWQLSGGGEHVCDASNASRTLLYNLDMGDFDPWLLACFDIPLSALPTVRDSSGVIAHTSPEVCGARIPITGVAGDQQAALFGQACLKPGMAKNTYGTGCFLLMNSGPQPVVSQHGLLSTVAWRIGGVSTYALEGSVFVAGALIQWLRDELGLLRDSAESAALANSVADSAGVHLVPAFVGLGAPWWDSEARGLICGLTRGSTRAHIVRAALESVAFQSADLLAAMEADLGAPLAELRVDGGMCSNDFLMQCQADLLDRPVSRPAQRESTAFGAALLAGLGSGVWGSLDELSDFWQLERRFTAAIGTEQRRAQRHGWHQAVARARHLST